MFDHEDLRAFAEVATSGTFTAAAKALITTQPSLSRRVARLEEAVGGALFERSGRTPKLTALGHTLLPYARDLIAHADAFAQLARTYGEGGVEEVVVAIREPLTGPCLPHLARCIEQVADLQLRVLEVPTNQFGVPNALLQYQAELGLVSNEFLQSLSFPAIDCVTFGVVAHYAVGLSEFLGHRDDPIEWEDVATHPLLLPVPAAEVTYLLPRMIPVVRHEAGSSGLLLAMAQSGLGIAILAEAHSGQHLVSRPIEVGGKPQRSEVHLMWRRYGLLSVGAQRVVDTVRARLANAGLPLLGEGRAGIP